MWERCEGRRARGRGNSYCQAVKSRLRHCQGNMRNNSSHFSHQWENPNALDVYSVPSWCIILVYQTILRNVIRHPL